MKRCVRCGAEKPATAFYPNRRMRSGLGSWCRECQVERNRQWRAENPDYTHAAKIAKRVANCGDPRGIRGAGRAKTCVECGAKFRARRDTALVCSRKCGDDRWRRLNPEKARACARNKNHSRRRRMQGTTVAPRLSNQDVAVLLAAAKTCPLCQKPFLTRGLRRPELDHVVPLVIGGTHTVGNVLVICRGCNLGRPKDGSDVGQEALWARAV